jgi:hypothetical protein
MIRTDLREATVAAEQSHQWLSQIRVGCEAIERPIDPCEEPAVAPREPHIALSGVGASLSSTTGELPAHLLEAVTASPRELLVRFDELLHEDLVRENLESLEESLELVGRKKDRFSSSFRRSGPPLHALRLFINEIVGRSHWGQICVGTATMQDSIMLNRYASDEQRKQYLEPLVAGDIVPSVRLTEPEVAGSDPTLMRATAVLDGDEWVINAHKWFTTSANIAAFTTVFCKTDPQESNKYRQFSSIIVPTDTPGYEIVRVVPPMGHTGGGHCEIRLRDVRVPQTNLLGPRGHGFTTAHQRLGPDLPPHELARAGAARLRADVRARQQALGARLAARRQGRDPALHLGVGGRDPSSAPDDARRGASDGRGQRSARRDHAHQVLGSVVGVGNPAAARLGEIQ